MEKLSKTTGDLENKTENNMDEKEGEFFTWQVKRDLALSLAGLGLLAGLNYIIATGERPAIREVMVFPTGACQVPDNGPDAGKTVCNFSRDVEKRTYLPE